MKFTVLEMVQDIMSDMDSDEVTSISDTPEAGQVARVLKQIFLQFCANQTIPEHEEMLRLEDISLVDFPGALNYLHIPDTVQSVMFFKYNRIMEGDTSDSFTELKYLEPQDFMNLVNKNRSDDTTNNTQVTDISTGVTYYINKTLPPTWWTSFDDEYIAVDSLDMNVDTTQLVGDKSIIWVTTVPTWTDDDDAFIPDIDDNIFPYLIAEAKSTCFVNLKQQANPKIEKQGRDQKIAIQIRKYRESDAQKARTANTGPNYGRKTIRG